MLNNAVAPILEGTPGSVTLVSVYPKEQRLELRHKGITTYIMPAARKGEFTTLVVRDTYAFNRNYSAPGVQLYPAHIPASVVAENLVQRWKNGHVGAKEGLGPGIAICAGDTPTPDEVESVRVRQEEYFRTLIHEADSLFAKEGGLNIRDDHRMAADWMGTQERPWFKAIKAAAMVRCPACAEEIRAEAKLCRFCRTNIADFLAASEKPVKAGKHDLIG